MKNRRDLQKLRFRVKIKKKPKERSILKKASLATLVAAAVAAVSHVCRCHRRNAEKYAIIGVLWRGMAVRIAVLVSLEQFCGFNFPAPFLSLSLTHMFVV